MKKLAIRVSLLVAVLMLVGKWVAYILTGSVAILSDAAESVVHIAATGFAAMSLWYADQPADRQHPYGHRRITYFSVGVEGGLILFAALTILYSAVQSLIQGPAIHDTGLGVGITGALAFVNLLLGWFLIHTGKKHNSTVLVANGHHVLTDMWTSVGVVAGIGVVALTDLLWLDPLVAIAVALHILRTAYGLIRKAYDGLMDTAEAETTTTILKALERCVADKVIDDFHQLRHRSIDHVMWIELHILVDGELTVWEGHERTKVVEAALQAALPDVEVHVTSHLEPDEHHAAHPDGHIAEDPLTSSN